MSDLVYSRASLGAKTFSGILQNVSDPNNPEDISLDNAARYFVQFLSPSGVLIEKEARVNREEVENTGDDMDIYYTTTPNTCLLYTSPSPRDRQKSRMPSSA